MSRNDIGKELYELRQKRYKKIFAVSLILIAIIIVLILFSTIFSLININNKKIMNGIKIQGIDVSNLTIEEAKNKLNSEVEKKSSKNIILKQGEEYESTISSKQIEFMYDIDNAVNNAFLIGRSGKVVKDNYDILFSTINGKNIDIEVQYNNSILEYLISDMSKKMPNALIQSGYYIEDDKLVITKGKEGLVINTEQLKNLIIDELKNIKEENKTIEVPVENKLPDEIDVQKIYDEVATDPKDAYYTEDPFEIHAHVNGVEFLIDEAKEKLEKSEGDCIIDLQITKPKITTDNLGINIFPDLLSKCNTKYDVTNVNRVTNLKLASDKINETVVAPGETFSYNQVVGARTIEAGYKEAAIYSGGKVVDGLGGGICQISSTLYNAVLRANLEIVERRNHQFKPSYTNEGTDATVVYGSIDFKFKNTRKYPIKIISTVKNGIADIEIRGIKEETEYQVEIISETLEATPFETTYITDSALEKGQEVVLQNGQNGLKTQTYRVLKLGNVTISKTLISKDTYNPMEKIIAIGE